MRYMEYKQFANVKKFHISLPVESFLPMNIFYKKLKPVASVVRDNFQKVIIPATFVLINETIVQSIY